MIRTNPHQGGACSTCPAGMTGTLMAIEGILKKGSSLKGVGSGLPGGLFRFQ